jgi:hypothetical protein
MKNLFLDFKKLFTKKNSTVNKIKNRAEATAKQQANIARSRGKQVYIYGGCMGSNPQAIFTPKRTKFKGWMRSTGQSLRERKNMN